MQKTSIAKSVVSTGDRWLDAGGSPIHNARRDFLDSISEDLAMLPHCNNIPDAKLMGFLPGALHGIRSTLYNLECLGYTITAPDGTVITGTATEPKFPIMNLWDDYVTAINT